MAFKTYLRQLAAERLRVLLAPVHTHRVAVLADLVEDAALKRQRPDSEASGEPKARRCEDA
jgi:hypothetical protein